MFDEFELLPILKSSVGIADEYYESEALKIMPVYPNPVKVTAQVQFATMGGHITLKLYNLNGQLQRVLVDRQLPKGSQFVTLSSNGLSKGQYVLVLQNGIAHLYAPLRGFSAAFQGSPT